MKRLLLAILLNSIAFFSNAELYIKDITIEREWAIIKTYSKQYNPPSCVSEENRNTWIFATNNISGQSMYLSILTAASQKLPILITTSSDCSLYPGIERLNTVTIVSPK